MPPSLDPDILKYLTSGENIRLAFEIGRYAPKLKLEILKSFWEGLYATILKTLPAGYSAADFTFITPVAMDDPYTKLRVIPTNAIKQPRQLAFTIEQESNDKHYDLYLGLHWHMGLNINDALYQKPPLSDLKLQFDSGGCDYFNSWWVGCRFIQRFDSLEDFVCDYVEDRSAILELAATAFWSLVEHHLLAVNEVNRIISNAESNPQLRA